MDIEENKDNQQLVKQESNITVTPNVSSGASKFIAMLKEAEDIADWVVKSETYGVAFEKKVIKRDADGKPELDENGDKQYTLEKNKADVVSAILLGKELGIEPMAAITFGKQLNADAYRKVVKGRSLGLDPMTSLSVINVINTQNGPLIHTGQSVITDVIGRNKVQTEILEDAVPVYKYVNAINQKDVDISRLKPNEYVIITANTDPASIKKDFDAGLFILIPSLIDVKTTVRLTREGFKPITITYTRQDAIDAGLYKGINSDGEEVKGKPNWNSNLKTMLRNRATTIAGRLILGDKLNNLYSNEEAASFTTIELDSDGNVISQE
ncbi:hypothetical protein DSECCO2_120550 [anaerobic digester metagenome]